MKAEMNRIEVLEMCEESLHNLSSWRKSLFEKAIKKEMSKKFFPAKTREKAERRLMEKANETEEWNIAGWGHFETLNLLRTACLTCLTETVWLDEKELYSLQAFSN